MSSDSSDERDRPAGGFVPLRSVKGGPPDAADALAEIRRIYFSTTRQTVEHDFAHAIALLTSLVSEEQRERAAVFMDGINEMRRKWAGDAARSQTRRTASSKAPSTPATPARRKTARKPRND